MGFFPGTIAAMLAGRTVRSADLVQFDFLSATMRVWRGHGVLPAGGHDWLGLGEVGSIDGVEQALGGTAPVTNFVVSGVDQAILNKAKGEVAEFYKRLVKIHLQFFDEDWQTLDAPYPIWFGIMQDMQVSRSPSEDGRAQRVITVPAESLFTGRARPRFGFLTDRDQKGRSPGDRYCERVPELQQKVVKWPDY